MGMCTKATDPLKRDFSYEAILLPVNNGRGIDHVVVVVTHFTRFSGASFFRVSTMFFPYVIYFSFFFTHQSKNYN